ncbi:MAG: DUF1489 family protein, partial [Alphaproteobacteria bacterium]
MTIHLKKLAAGIESVAELTEIMQQRAKLGADKVCAYTTNKPTRGDEIIESGSLYWVIKGKISARQKVLGYGTWVDDIDRTRATIILDKEVIPTEHYPHRPFQGWRYLKPQDAPKDLSQSEYKDIDTEDFEKLSDLGI